MHNDGAADLSKTNQLCLKYAHKRNSFLTLSLNTWNMKEDEWTNIYFQILLRMLGCQFTQNDWACAPGVSITWTSSTFTVQWDWAENKNQHRRLYYKGYKCKDFRIKVCESEFAVHAIVDCETWNCWSVAPQVLNFWSSLKLQRFQQALILSL